MPTEPKPNQLTTAEAAMSFIQAGNATFTVLSVAKQNRFTYKVTESDDGKCFFVGLLSGPDNEASYSYIGIIRDGVFRRTAKSKVGPEAPSFKAFDWLYNNQLAHGKLPGCVEFFHCGSCGRCGRTLTVPESIQSGYGPECIRRIGREAA